MEKIYFDNGSTSWPKAPKVAEAMADLLTHGAFNINRGNYEGAYEVEATVLDTREQLARLFHAKDSRSVIFTPGITYSLNYFIKGFLQSGDHVLVSGMEHNAVMRPLKQMEAIGVTYDVVRTEVDGTIQPEDVELAIKNNTKAMIMLHASNVCGTIVPIKAIGEICRRHHLFFVVDTAQSAGTIPVDMQECNVDFLAFTGHKGFLGPQGIGGFLISEELNDQMKPYIAGGTGSQSDVLLMPESLPDKYESGTMNLPGIIGLHAALSYIEETGIETIHRKKMELTQYFLENVKEFSNIRIVGKKGMKDRVAVVSLDFVQEDNAVVAFELEQYYGIMTRVGLHCAPIAHRTLHTYPQGTVRFAFSASNTRGEIDQCIEGFREILSV
ncbi:aminotransferase class V-fold PLP-dependent enzyme [Faecalicatena contorta]|uniref:aminotransferase class V-fold PLP-dependent enzyme n=1 Tax=Lachnospiraceae TaxID=186803 RepID=UPI001F267A71|nr:aminotransferase class V-fold PLP-dependent enzyme [Faecalicatena contorta]MCF2668044.1 aminotransferase class V-fold PLP-dependent enzyme [Faecalicatena contorta]